MKAENFVALFVAVFIVCVACSMWFRADKVDAGITDQKVDSLETAAATPDSLEEDSLEVLPDTFVLEEIPEEPQLEEGGGQ